MDVVAGIVSENPKLETFRISYSVFLIMDYISDLIFELFEIRIWDLGFLDIHIENLIFYTILLALPIRH